MQHYLKPEFELSFSSLSVVNGTRRKRITGCYFGLH